MNYFLDLISHFGWHSKITLNDIQDFYEDRFIYPNQISVTFREWLTTQRPDARVFYRSLIGNGAEFDETTMLHQIHSVVENGFLRIELEYSSRLTTSYIRKASVLIFLVDEIPQKMKFFEDIHLIRKRIKERSSPVVSNRGILATYVFSRTSITHSSNIEYAARDLGIFVREWKEWEKGITSGNAEILVYR